jgi:predicted transcriptional regulator of viral defense system
VYLRRLTRSGQLERVTRGVYRAADEVPGPHHGLAVVAARNPNAAISLLSALSFHGMTNQLPPEVWITIHRKGRTPKPEWPQLHVTYSSGEAVETGVQVHVIEGIPVRITSPARTVADCFKYRSTVGLDVALEALREYRRKKLGSMEELERSARSCRVSRVMRPYLEALWS